MKKKLKILMAFSEVAPFAKTGGLADVGGALPKALKDLGHDIRVIMPQYREVNERRYILRDVIRLQNISVQMGDESLQIQVKSAFLPNSKVQIYFIDYKPFYFREGLYVDPKTGKDYSDNAARFILFCKGALETLRKLQWQPDVIHCNDWQTGMIPFLLKKKHHDDPFFTKTFTLMTIHNFVYQGIYPATSVHLLENGGIADPSGYPIVEDGTLNFLRTGITDADWLNTVSETYCREVQSSSEFGCGLEDLLKARSKEFDGVINGLDETVWNPEKDSFIETSYTADAPEGKQEAKRLLLEKVGLPYRPDVPVIGMTSRLTSQKGFDLIQAVFPKLMELDVYFILLGQGEARYQSFFRAAQKKYPKRVHVSLTFDESLAHRIAAGSDMFLMPSLQEPCGLTQLYSLKYGTVPIVHQTGGLADTVKLYDGTKNKGTGFFFQKPDPEKLLEAIRTAVQVYADSTRWKQLMFRGMTEDFSWSAASRKYVELYQKAISKGL
ncbi:MAG TPA: glycogen synthase GlgA [bacterium]|nr:glycogen synthase GlgA [bacterium]